MSLYIVFHGFLHSIKVPEAKKTFLCDEKTSRGEQPERQRSFTQTIRTRIYFRKEVILWQQNQ
jgi:hypothetical protein